MVANNNNELFEVEVPAPLAKFHRSVIDPDNELIIREAGDARLLPQTLVRKYERLLKQHSKEVEQAGYDKLKDRYETLKKEWGALQLYLYHLNEQLKTADEDERQEVTDQIRDTTDQQLVIQKKAARLKKRISPILPTVRKRDLIQQKLKGHYAAIEHEKADKEIRKKLAKEAAWFAGMIVERWAQLGYCHRTYVQRQGRTIEYVDKVRIERCVVTPDSIQFKIMVNSVGLFGQTIIHLPHLVRGYDLIKEETLRELTMACEREVTSPHLNGVNFVNGTWLVMSRNDFVDGLPKLVYYKAVMTRYPHEIKHKFPLILGVRQGRKVNIVKLSEHPHLLINGQSGAGKSNTMHCVLSQLIQMHSPQEMRLALIDLKAGVELRIYGNTPHVLGGGVIKDLAPAAKLLFQLSNLITSRLEEIQKIGALASDIETYNRYAPAEKRMPRIFIVFEEIQLIDKDKELAKSIRASLDVIASTGRAAGIQLILCTQASFSDVIPKITQANISCKILGSQETLGASLASGGSTKAQHLMQLPGRMLVKRGPDHIEVQMQLITDEDKLAAIEAASKWDAAPPLELFAELPKDEFEPEKSEFDVEEGEIIQLPRPVYHSDEELYKGIAANALQYTDGQLNYKRLVESGATKRMNITTRKLKELLKGMRAVKCIEVYTNEFYDIEIGEANIAHLRPLSNSSDSSLNQSSVSIA